MKSWTTQMNSRWLGEDGYPTDECLEAVKTMGIAEGVFDILKEAWKFGGVSHFLRHEEAAMMGGSNYDPPGKYWRFATGGWSGNEDLMEAFANNFVYAVTWKLSAAGGLHIFEVPDWDIEGYNLADGKAQRDDEDARGA